MKKISRRSFLAASGLTIAALALTACGRGALREATLLHTFTRKTSNSRRIYDYEKDDLSP